MQSEFTFDKLLRANLDIESGDMTFIDSTSMSIDMSRVRLLGLHLLACSQVRREDVEWLLEAIDEPTLQEANEKAIETMNTIVGIIAERIRVVLELPEIET